MKKNNILTSIRNILVPVLICLVVALIIKIGQGAKNPITLPGISHPGEDAASEESTAIGIMEDASLSVHIIDVGQGSAALFYSDGEWMLFDGADRDYAQKVVAYLKEKGVDKLKYVIASHYDSDHISGIVGVLNTIPVESIFGPTYEADTRTYYSLMNKVKENGLEMIMPPIGSEYSLGSASFKVLAPIRQYDEENANSIVIRISCAGKSIYLGGDQTEESERDMIISTLGSGLKSDVLIVNHHGSSTSSSALLLGAVRPSTVIISCGKNNEYGHPAKSVMNRLKVLGADLYRTDMQGEILFSITKDGVAFEKEPINDYTPGEMPIGKVPYNIYKKKAA